MAEGVSAVQTAVRASRAELVGLAPIELLRTLAPVEVEPVQALRWRSEQLRWQLVMLRDEFEQV